MCHSSWLPRVHCTSSSGTFAWVIISPPPLTILRKAISACWQCSFKENPGEYCGCQYPNLVRHFTFLFTVSNSNRPERVVERDNENFVDYLSNDLLMGMSSQTLFRQREAASSFSSNSLSYIFKVILFFGLTWWTVAPTNIYTHTMLNI